MSQFDVHRTVGPARKLAPYLVVLQTDLLETASLRVVAPLRPVKGFGPPVETLHVPLLLAGKSYVMSTEELASVPVQALGERVGSVATYRSAIFEALDFLFTGI
jgi:toxin CcdB